MTTKQNVAPFLPAVMGFSFLLCLHCAVACAQTTVRSTLPPCKDATQCLNRPGDRTRELIPARYLKRYLSWKNEYLSTESGWQRWEHYAHHPTLTLTIIVSEERRHGAQAGGYQWDAEGKLITATITLGHKLDSGYPGPVNYPVMCSLMLDKESYPVGGKVLAATKLAHEFGHVDRTASMDGALYQLQNKLIPEYNRIFRANGRHVNDPRLHELVKQMGGTPVQINQGREHWAEASTVLYLRERFPRGKEQRRRMPRPIRRAIEGYYLTYPGRLQ